MPRDKVKRWNPPEIIEVLKFINDNFNTWFENQISTYNKLIAVANLDRDAKSIYNKVHTLIRLMEDYIRTRKKSNPRDIIWENKKINGLLKDICKKYKEKREKGEMDDNQVTTNTDQATTNASTSQMDVDGVEVIDLENLKETVDNLDINRDPLKETFDTNYQEIRVLSAQISQRQSELQAMKTELQAKETDLERMETEREEKKEILQNVYRQMGLL